MSAHEPTGQRTFALPGSSLQYGPDKTVDVEHIDLHLTPDLQRAHLEGICTMTVRALDEPVCELSLNAVDMRVTSVTRDGSHLRFISRPKTLDVFFDSPIAPGETATFAICYSVTKPRQGLFFIEPTAEYPNRVTHAWTQSQDENARYWFPCLDYPHEKQSTSATIVVPKGLFALSNGALVERRDDGDKTVFRYRQDVPHATYLVTMVVGPFIERCQREGVFFYVLPGREADGERSFGKTPQMIDIFEERLAMPYPYARYSQIAVTDFIFGGMENTSATTQTDRTLHDQRAHLDFSSDPLVAHELAHQWFGDLLTCRDWSHAWLNEGFATYFEAIFREADLGCDEYLYDIYTCVQRYIEEEAQRYRRPIVYNRFRDPIELFDRHLYEKGAAVLHMLRGELGDARFWRSIRRYVRDNAQRSVETIDFIRAIEHATGRNLRAFFDCWVFRGGHPRPKVAVAYDAKRRTATLTIDQQQPVDEEHPAFAFDVTIGLVPELPGGLIRNAGAAELPGERRLRVRVEHAHEVVTIPVDFEPRLVRFDPGAYVLGDVSYAFGTELAAATFTSEPDPIARIRAGNELAKDGSQAAREALSDAFEREVFWGVLVHVAHALGETHAPWARDILVRALSHEHPKVRRAVAAALGAFQESGVATALIAPATHDASYFVRASALESLGRTRDPRAFEILRCAMAEQSWNGVVESAAAAGLGELADARSTALLVAASAAGHEEALRRSALHALARQAELVESERSKVVETIVLALDDPMFMVVRAAVAAAERLADRRLIGPLDRLAAAALDGRLRRDASEAAARIREAQVVPAQVSGLRTDLDQLREEHKKIQEKIEALSRA